MNELDRILNDNRLVKEPIEAGIVPIISFDSMVRSVSAVSKLIVFGNVPVIEFDRNLIVFMLRKLLIELGSEPCIPINAKSKLIILP